MNKGWNELIIIGAIALIAALIIATQILTVPPTPTGHAISTVTLNPIHDGQISYTPYSMVYTWYNDASSSTLSVLNYSTKDDGGETRVYLKFDLTGETDFSSAYLSLTTVGGSLSSDCPKLYKIDDYAVFGNEPGGGWIEENPQPIADLPCNDNAYINVTSFIASNTINAFMIKKENVTQGYYESIQYGSVESSNKPELELTYNIEIPAVPTGLTAVPGPNPGKITVDWSWAAGTQHFILKKQKGNNPPTESAVICCALPPLTLTTEEPAELFTFNVKACNSASECSAYSSSFTSYPKIGSAEAGGPYSGTIEENIQLNGTISFAVNPTYSWSITSNPSGCTLNGSTTLNPVINCSTSGDRTVQLIVTNADNQNSSDTATVTVSSAGPLPPQNVQANSGPDPGKIQISWDAVADAIQYFIYWSKDPDTTGMGSTIGYTNAPVTLATHTTQEPAARYYYTVRTWDGSNFSDYSSPPASAYPMLGASISGSSSAEVDTSFTLNGSALYPVGSASYSWSLPSGCSSGTTNQQNITMSCTTTGTKTATLTVSTAAQGTAQATKNVDITDSGIINPPSSISPVPGTVPGRINVFWEQTGANFYRVHGSKSPSQTGTDYLVAIVVSGGGCTDSTTLPGALHYYKVKACNTSTDPLDCGDFSTATGTSYPRIGANANGSYSGEPNQDIQLNATSTFVSVDPAEYDWSLSNNTANCSLDDSTLQNPTINCAIEGNADIPLTVRNSGSTLEEGTDSTTITITQSGPEAPDTPTWLTAVSGPNTGELTIDWDEVTNTDYYILKTEKQGEPPVESEHILAGFGIPPLTSSTAEPAALHTFSVKACNSNGCSAYSVTDSAYPKIGNAISGGSYAGIIGEDIQLNATIEYAVNPSYSWSITNNNAYCNPTTLTGQTPTINCNSIGESTLILNVTADNGTATDSTIITITEEPDTIPPTIQITYPSNNSTVNGTVLIQATATDNIAIKNVKFYIDNSLKATDTFASYEYSWNTTSETNASHSIKATAEDTTGNTAETQITVTVNNVSGPECGNAVIETGEDCELDAECYALYSRGKCNTTTKKHESRSVTCNSCSCVAGNWTETNLYCDVCSHCGDGTQNCNETAETCPADFGGEQDTTSPEKPTGLEAIRTTENSITIQWNPNTEDDLKRYKIYYQKTRGIEQETIATKNETGLTLTGLEPLTQYFISISAMDSSGNESEYSDEVSATTKPKVITEIPAPKNLTAKLEEEKVLLEWTHTTPKPDYYIIQRKIKGESFNQIDSTTENYFTDEKVKQGEKYFYRIAGFKNGKTSDYSDETEIEIKKEAVKCPTEKDGLCDEGCENDPDCESDLVLWGIGGAIVVVSIALAYIFFNFDV